METPTQHSAVSTVSHSVLHCIERGAVPLCACPVVRACVARTLQKNVAKPRHTVSKVPQRREVSTASNPTHERDRSLSTPSHASRNTIRRRACACSVSRRAPALHSLANVTPDGWKYRARRPADSRLCLSRRHASRSCLSRHRSFSHARITGALPLSRQRRSAFWRVGVGAQETPMGGWPEGSDECRPWPRIHRPRFQ